MTQREWRLRARQILGAGLGVENISLKLDVPVEDVRALVAALRASGQLEAVLWGGRVTQ